MYKRQVQPFLDSFDTPLTYGMTEYAGRSYSERGTNYGYGGRTSTNVIIRPKNGKGSMIAPASGRVLLAKDLGGLYGLSLIHIYCTLRRLPSSVMTRPK